jgi:hypothetical protein
MAVFARLGAGGMFRGRGLLTGAGLFGKIPRRGDNRAAGDTRAQWDWRGGGPEGAARPAVGGAGAHERGAPQSPVSGAAGNAPQFRKDKVEPCF